MKLNDIFYYFTWDPGSVLRRSVPARYLSLFVGHDAMGKLVASRRPALWSDDLLSNNQDGIRFPGSEPQLVHKSSFQEVLW